MTTKLFKRLVTTAIFCLFLFGAFHVSAQTTSHLSSVPPGYVGIYSAKDLQQIRNDLLGQYILMNDIDLAEAGSTWTPIGNSISPFKGIFNGNGYTVKNLNVQLESSSQPVFAGFFGYASTAKISNLHIDNAVVTANNKSLTSNLSLSYAGGVLGYGYNTEIDHCSVSGTVSAHSFFVGYAGGISGGSTGWSDFYGKITASENAATIYAKTAAGGITGEASQTIFSDVHNKGSLAIESSDKSGGIVGLLRSNSTVKQASNTGTIEFKTAGGGIAGDVRDSVFQDVNNTGDVMSSLTSAAGGGIIGTSLGSTQVSNSFNTGEVVVNGSYSSAGGIVGQFSGDSITQSYNEGNVTGGSSAGGIVGSHYKGVVSQTYNTGSMAATFSGGISGYTTAVTILDSYNIGTIYGQQSGGIVGHGSNTTIINTYNVGTIANRSYSGGIAGEYNGTIENSYYLDTISSGVGTGTSTGTYRKSYNELTQANVYKGFDFSKFWTLDSSGLFKTPFLEKAPSASTENAIVLSVSTQPKKLIYQLGEELDLTDGMITLLTNHGNQLTKPMTNGMATGYNPIKLGQQTITINEGNLSTSLTIEVKALVTFLDDNGVILKTEWVSDGGSATAPVPPSKEGYTFTGWSEPFTNIKKNVTITAQYTPNIYSVNYWDGDQILYTDLYQYGSILGLPQTPVKEGHTFLNWYQDAGYQRTFEFFQEVKKETNLYAKFAKNPSMPQEMKITPDGNKLIISWKPSEGANGYDIARSTSPDGPYNYFYGIGSESKNYTIGDLTPGTTYYYKIRSYSIIDGQYIYSDYTNVMSGTVILKNGWIFDSNHWSYYTNGTLVTGWVRSGGAWYFMDSKGVMQTGWIKDGNTWYFLQKNGAMKTGWLSYGGQWYFLQTSGAMKTGWLLNGGTWYYFETSGVMKKGWLFNGGKWYYFYPSGAMAINTTIGKYRIGINGAML
jgi:uncharacterized repeat protein (TIGR02543 family)